MTANGDVSPALAAAVAELEQQLPAWSVPALEVAVVSRGSGTFAGALGRRGADDPSPVGTGTMFHHGSCAKAYTALLATLLAEEQLLDLDAPVRRLVPELRLRDPLLTERITVRDLLSHRSGLGRHDLAWIFRPELDASAMIRALADLTPAGDLRAGMEYSNFGYALAGVAIARAGGAEWTEQLRTRVLEPAGLKQTTGAPFPSADGADDRAVPHVLRDGRAVETSWRSLGVISPAGQVVTCAEDAVGWLRLQLGDGPAAIPATAVAATQHPQVTLPPDASPQPEVRWLGYALGWITGTFRGRPLLWHSGGIDGFLTNTLLLPDEGIGITACANLHMSDLPFAAVHQLADVLLGTATGDSWYARVRAEADEESPATVAPERADAPPSHPLPAFAGTYADAGYGQLEITAGTGALRARIGAAELDLRHRHFDTWDAYYAPLDERFPVTFVTDADGGVAEAVAPLDAGGPPIRFTRSGPAGSAAAPAVHQQEAPR